MKADLFQTDFSLEGKVRGEEIAFTADGREYHGKLNGKQLELR